ncbi:hypothetical protein OO015_07850 [Thermomicrobium sp. 4228-Ro]|uniref:hypothetical protein n=1 Tax=Thermomicrobium sp. 4228-Ro TaxID=2993937 RepID=UPI002248D17F|nr:hypothetical protein [Thermomicrobium sp. 4228-Ro]MCX2727406.1 hypothetical protein [Thermomicrobium sp. 4228-Ro]
MESRIVAATPFADIREEVKRILEAAETRGVTLRVLGGVAVYLHSPSATHRALQRTYRDADFMGLSAQKRAIESLFAELGYQADREFNTLHGHQRLFFWDPQHERQIDVFLDQLRMCHTLDLRGRLDRDRLTLPLADLLLTKLQIWEANEKDLIDIVALLHDHPLGYGDEETIDIRRIVDVLSNDWGWYRTAKENVERVRSLILERELQEEFVSLRRLEELWRAVEDAPKSRAWKLRAMIGERKRWYELPEEVRHD